MAENELLNQEKEKLEAVSSWYNNTQWGFYTKIVWYTYVSIKPFFIGQDCLEMGPADGEMTKFIAQDFVKLEVVDASSKYVRSAEKLGNNITGHASLFEKFNPKKKYDTIIMAHILEHVVDPVAVLDLAKKWLKENGRIIVVVPNADSLHRQLGVKLGLLSHKNQLNEQDVEIGHRRVYDRETLDIDIEKSNLKIMNKGGVFIKLLANSQMQSFEDDKLIDGMFELGKDFPQFCSEIYAVCYS